MSVVKINSGLPITEKITQLNNQTVEIDGKVSTARFDKNEIEAIHTSLGLDRKFLRDVALGNSLATYTGWTHLKAESGYSIWKFTPTNYAYNALNELYLNSKALVNKGLATSESATVFDSVFLYDGSSFTDVTTEAGTETGTEFDLISGLDDFIYIGSDSIFHGVKFEFKNKGSDYGLKVEYYAGSLGWIELTESAFDLVDNTSDFTSDGAITWNSSVDSNWETEEINSATKYWIRISTVTVPAVVAEAYYIIPNASVIGLLALSYSEITNEEWSWCSYDGAIYATVRNIGNVYSEGDYYISSTSSTANKINFFVYNNEFTLNYEDDTYSPGLPEYADNAAAVSAGLVVGNLYRTGDTVKICH